MRIQKGAEKIKLTWPAVGAVFTVKDIVALNTENGKPKISAVSIQARLNNMISDGSVISFGEERTGGRPRLRYRMIADKTGQPIADKTEQPVIATHDNSPV